MNQKNQKNQKGHQKHHSEHIEKNEAQTQKSSVFANTIKNFLRPISSFLEDDQVSEILINGFNEIFIESEGHLKKTQHSFESEDHLQAAIKNIAQSVGKRVSEKEPRLDARLPNGSRIAAVFPPCSRKGTVVSIRKFNKKKISFKDYIMKGAISGVAAQFLDICTLLGKNILISGGTGSGKTTLLSLLASRIPKGQRVIVIEDSSELDIPYEHIVNFEARPANEEGEGQISIEDLLVSSLRLRPDRIVVGEVRGAEALHLIHAMNTGHRGCMGTLHANSPEDALLRLEGLITGGGSASGSGGSGGGGGGLMRRQISSAIDLIVQISRCMDGGRRVTEISEVLKLHQGEYQIRCLFKFHGVKKGESLVGELEPTGNLPTFRQEIQDLRLPFSMDSLKKKKPAA